MILGLHIVNVLKYVSDEHTFVIRDWELKCVSVVTVAYFFRMGPKVWNITKRNIETLM
jgi:hypothetical protein